MSLYRKLSPGLPHTLPAYARKPDYAKSWDEDRLRLQIISPIPMLLPPQVKANVSERAVAMFACDHESAIAFHQA